MKLRTPRKIQFLDNPTIADSYDQNIHYLEINQAEELHGMR